MLLRRGLQFGSFLHFCGGVPVARPGWPLPKGPDQKAGAGALDFYSLWVVRDAKKSAFCSDLLERFAPSSGTTQFGFVP